MSPPGTSKAPRAPHAEGLDCSSGDQAGRVEHGTSALLIATAVAYAPAGRRTAALLLVRRCPFCGHAHAHRETGSGDLRRSGCDRGRYLVQAGPA